MAPKDDPANNPGPPASLLSNRSDSESEDEEEQCATLNAGPASNAVTPNNPSSNHNHNHDTVSALPAAFEHLNISTPMRSSGTASYARTMTSTALAEERKMIHLHYTDDLDRTLVVSGDVMIKLLLCSVLQVNGEPITTQRVDIAYGALYDKALGLCNAQSGQEKVASKIMGSIRAQIAKYVTARNEKGCYGPFVTIGNLVMDLCRDVQVDDVKPAQVGDEEFLFQVNDPCRMHDKYRRGMDDAPILRNTYRKPDILGTMFAAVRAVTKHPNTRDQCKTRDEYIEHGHEQKRPQKFLSWVDARIAAEFKYKVPTNKTKVTPQGDWSRKAAPTPRGSARELIQDNPEVQGSSARTLPSFGMAVTSGAASGHVGSGGSKRKHSEAAGGVASASNKRAKREEVEGDGDPEDPEDPDGFVDEDDGKAKVRGVLNGAVQLAIYASARLSSSSMICHSLNLLVDGRIMWIWYFDQGRIVCSEGMDIFDDFPFFVMLLAIFQRMDRHAFGQHAAFTRVPELAPPQEARRMRSDVAAANASQTVQQLRGQGTWTFTAKEPSGREQQFSFEPGSVPQLLELVGRGTAVFDVKAVETPGEPAMFCGVPYSNLEMVVKIYHPEGTRTSEVDILKRAYAEAQKKESGDFIPSDWLPSNGQHHIQGHLPVLVACADHEDSFSPYLEALGIKCERGTKRCLRLLVFLKLNKITDLSGSEYIKAWLDCLLCHAALWRSNVHHRDISVANLMYYRLDGKVYGVLNDYDLSILPDQKRTLGTERTGTWPFMAVDMLLAPDNNPLHIYDYDAESFLWCLLWTTHRYMDGKVPPKLADVFNGWTLRDPEYAARNKRDYMIDLKFKLTSSHKSSRRFIVDICEAFCDRNRIANKQARDATFDDSSDSNSNSNPDSDSDSDSDSDLDSDTAPPPPPRLLPVLLAAIKKRVPAEFTPLPAALPKAPEFPSDTYDLLSVHSPAWVHLGKADSFDQPPV